MTENYLNILSKEEYSKWPSVEPARKRFVISENSAVTCHLGDMFNAHVERTDKILLGGDCILFKSDFEQMVELIKIEEQKLGKIFLDSWEFQVHPKIKYINYENLVRDYGQTKAYLAEKSIFNSKYEIKSGKLGECEFVVDKKWHRVKKTQIEDFLSEFESLMINAIKGDLIIIATYF